MADVGTKAKNAESNLAKIFALATSWQAILLMSVSFSSSNDLKKGSYLIRYSDEADVFLESRGKGMTTNTERNALVSGEKIQNSSDLASANINSISPCAGVLPG